MDQPRILIVGSGERSSLESIYRRAIQRAGIFHVDSFQTDIYYKKITSYSGLLGRVIYAGTASLVASRVEKGLLRFLKQNPSRYDAIILFKGFEFSRSCLESGRETQPRALWININPDNPFNIGSRGSTNSKILASLSFFDLYCIWSRALVVQLQKRGCQRVEYLPFGYDPELYAVPSKAVSINPQTVVFVGDWDRSREVALCEISDYNLNIYGNRWDRLIAQSPLRHKALHLYNIYEEELVKVVSENAVSLNLLRAQNTGAHNMRTFEIPAMGGLMLTTRSEEQNAFFPEGEASLMFKDGEEMRQQLDWAFANPDAASKIRRRAFELAQNHNYTQRAKQLLEMIRNV